MNTPHWLQMFITSELDTSHLNITLFFNDLFETTVHTGANDPVIDNICNDLFDYINNWYDKEEFDPDGQLIYHHPPLADI